MCGIAGIYHHARKLPENSRDILAKMGRRMAHRGPDDSGAHLSDHCGLSFRRLSIIDLVHGSQPMSSPSGKTIIVFNGEIYNFKALRKEIANTGVHFRTRSDTEVIAAGYEIWGEQVVTRLRGMFAFAIYSPEKNELFMARDHTGIKPLYYATSSGYFVFGSEIKAIFEVPDISPALNMAALPQFMSFLWVPAPKTLFENIFILEPGFTMRVNGDGITKKRYWTPNLVVQQNIRGVNDWMDLIDSELERIVEEQMISDVPLGAFLSGGVDSSTIIAFMNKVSDRKITTFTTGFNDDDLADDVIISDLNHARLASKVLNVDYNEIILSPDVVDLLPKLTWHMDEPVADPAAVTTYLICKAAKDRCTVMMSGIGGDEVFGGYPRYLANQIAEKYKALPGWFRNRVLEPLFPKIPTGSRAFIRNAKKFLKSSGLPFIEAYMGYLTYYGEEELKHLLSFDFNWNDIFETHRNVLSGVEGPDRLQTMMNLDLFTFLPNLNLMYTDKMSSAASVEVRVPFLDHLFVERMAKIPSRFKIRHGKRKYIFKKTADRYLPQAIVWRKKAGFGAPIGAWLKGQAYEMMRDLLSEDTLKKRGYFNARHVSRIIRDHLEGREYYANQLWQLMAFELWHQTFID